MKEDIEPNDIGRKQFFEWQSYGKKPEKPDNYFLCLSQGKKWFGVQQSDIRNSYLTWHWDGFYSFWKDFEGERWILKYLFSWHPNPPEWLFSETYEFKL